MRAVGGGVERVSESGTGVCEDDDVGSVAERDGCANSVRYGGGFSFGYGGMVYGEGFRGGKGSFMYDAVGRDSRVSVYVVRV